jgi:2'-5' RNA ligase
MGSCSVPGEPINQYALVTYLPAELGHFLDQMRRDLVAQCTARSHLSLLPPRSLQVAPQQAESQIQHLSQTTQPFVVAIGDVCIFPKTSVVYLELTAGQNELARMHDALSQGALEFDEPYPFHPHITLAQNFDVETVGERFETAKSKWASYEGPREFLLDRVVFVQNSASNCWADLRSFQLMGLPSAPTMQPVAQLSRTY